jgi:hypothetical protein
MLGTNLLAPPLSRTSNRSHLAHERDQIRDAIGIQSRAILGWIDRMNPKALVNVCRGNFNEKIF